MKKRSSYILMTAGAIAVVIALGVRAQMPALPDPAVPDPAIPELTAEQQAEADSLARLDSLALAHAAQIVGRADDAYRHLKFIEYDGTTEAQLFPVVIDVHGSTLDALATPRVDDSQKSRLRGILLDLDPLLIRGAVYYSSSGDSKAMTRFAKACVDTRLRDDMKQMPFGHANDALYPSIVYCAAADAYNSGDYPASLDYFEEYLDGQGTDQREQVALFYGQAAINAQSQKRAVSRLEAAANRYPTNYNLLMITLQDCLDAGELDVMQPLMERALLMKPDDEQLLNVQAALYEGRGNYTGALEMYSRLYDMHPESLSINKHLALCYYNLGVDYYNRSVVEEERKKADKLRRQSEAYFRSAVSKLATVLDNEPSNPKILKALAMCYGSLGETAHLAELNNRLAALGMSQVKMAGMPETISYGDSPVAAAQTSAETPGFQEFAGPYVTRLMAEYCKRGEFEKSEDYEKRLRDTYAENYDRVSRKVQDEYINKYKGSLRVGDLELKPYDADNECFLITSSMGDMVLPVPYRNKEAEAFKSGWEGTQLRNVRFYINNDRVAVAAADFVTPGGKTYSYSAGDGAEYLVEHVAVDVSSFQDQILADAATRSDGDYRNSRTSKSIRMKSDVDENIPLTSRRADKTVALVWANENYKNVTDVASAANDGEIFAEYCRKTLGIPENQVMLMENLTYAEMLSSLRRLRELVDAMGDGIDVIFYYAGHGLPDEGTKDAFLLPVDGDGVITATSLPLKQLYATLDGIRSDNTMVFLDACFSGATRDGDMLAKARGVALKPRVAEPEGNMFVLSAASDQQTAMPYKEKNHGLFTYFLLKKLQETKGNVSLADLAEYVTDNVKKNSIKVNNKLQTPNMSVSGRMREGFKSKKMRP